MQPTALFSLLPLLALVSAAPTSRTCGARPPRNATTLPGEQWRHHKHTWSSHVHPSHTASGGGNSTIPFVTALVSTASVSASSDVAASNPVTAQVSATSSSILIAASDSAAVTSLPISVSVDTTTASSATDVEPTTLYTLPSPPPPASSAPTVTDPSASTSASESATSAQASASASPPAVVAAAAPPSTNGGAGLAVDSSGYSQLAGTGLNWYWNWGLTAFDLPSIEFVPCVWGENVVSSVSGATFPNGTTHILGFNEPDMTSANGGSNLDSTKAATLHQQWTADLKADLKIGSPAVARGSLTWFNDWVTACDGKCKFDFVPLHFYGNNADDLISYVKTFPAQGKPTWITEFACHDYSTGYDCTAAETESFMKTAVEWFQGDGKAIVERWAWFGAFPDISTKSTGLENADGSLNALGKTYVSL
ncbi:hypothetical protein CI109_104189 [Kwoniella shandongensis]|uniref:Asl1-like glycosyl hydrolase catalytic domain-containing protein n=1 Tax=Kwoniella shandongensis TaxID=1734106 RepID=A0AAJ8LM28_9TREE